MLAINKICNYSRFSGTNSKRLSAKHRRRITFFDGCVMDEDDHSVQTVLTFVFVITACMHS